MLNKNTKIKISVIKKVFEKHNYKININTERVDGGQLTWLTAIGNNRSMFSLQLSLYENKTSKIKTQGIDTLCFRDFTYSKELELIDYENNRKQIVKEIMFAIKSVNKNTLVLRDKLIKELHIALTNCKLLEKYYEVSDEVEVLMNKFEDDAM